MKVVNKNSHKPTPHDIYVGRGSALGNPFTSKPFGQGMRVGSRAEAIEAFRQYLWTKMAAEDPAILAALRAITDDAVLVCYCAPLDCHAEVIARAATWLRQHEAR